MEVRAFAVRPHDDDPFFGADAVDLSTAGFDPTARTVSAPCDSSTVDELGIQLARSSAAGSATSGDEFQVRYRLGNGTGVGTVPFTVVLCAPDDAVTEDCS